MKYNYSAIKTEIETYLSTHSDEYFYVTDIAKELGYSNYVVINALKTITTNQIMTYTSEKLVYVTKNNKEKQVPESFVNKFIETGWVNGRCEASKRAICIAEGGDPDKIPQIWIHKETKNKQIELNELDFWIQHGWIKGKLNLSTLGKVAIHKDNIDKYVKPEEVSTYVEQGWLEGGKEKRNLRDYSNIWNKDKTKETDSRLLSISQKVSEYNLNMPQEERDKISLTIAKLWQDETYRQNQISHMRGRKPWNKNKRYHLTEEKRISFIEKCNETKKQNKSFNTSRPEEDYYNYLLTLYNPDDVVRQYCDRSRYPFHCDFYIKSEDRFIECNFHWTHNTHPFDSNNCEDITEAEKLKMLSETSEYYSIAYNVWTNLDVRKRTAAIEHNLNYDAVYGGKYGTWTHRCN